MHLGIDPTQIEGYAKALREGRDILLRELAKGYQQIGRYDIDKMRQSLQGSLNLRSKGAANSFKFKATDAGRVSRFDQLFTDEYTGWKAARIFETGGPVSGRGKQLTILTDAARIGSGRRKYTQQQLRQMIASGKASVIRTPRGALIVMHVGGLTKTGKMRKGSRDVILAILKKTVMEQKRIDFYANATSGESMHQDILETAVENTLVAIMQRV